MIKLGTSGYSFKDWVGPIYPSGTKNEGMLPYYEKELGFKTVEINFTYYRIPSARIMESMVNRTGDDFTFTIKLSKEMTHEIFDEKWNIVDNPEAFKQYLEGVRPMVQSGKLGCLLAQYPFSFIKKPQTIEYLLKCKERMGDIPLVAEFRHKSWVTPNTIESLRRHDIGFCIVDEPDLPKLMPYVAEATSDLGYFRFHGRNMNWFKASRDERYNYLYNKEELKKFLPDITAIAKKTKAAFVFFNNCHHGKAAINAKEMQEMIEEELGLL